MVEGNSSERLIVVCEPQCWGFEHSAFNAALLYSILLGYPEEVVVFMGEKEHIAWVKESLSLAHPEACQRVVWEEITIVPRYVQGWHRFQGEFSWCRHVFGFVAEHKIRFVCVCSITSIGLLSLKLLMHLKRTVVPVLAVPHSILETITARQPRKPWNWLITFRQALTFVQPGHLYYLALSPSIYQHLKAVLPECALYFRQLDLPHFWDERDCPGNDTQGIVRFGYFGVSSKVGFETFLELASDISRSSCLAEFTMVGFMNEQGDYTKYHDIVKDFANSPLKEEEYAQRAMSLTYAVGTSPSDSYTLAASASFLDALSYLKPGIYMRNPYVECYFREMGDIGYLCNSYEEMREVVLSILNNFPVKRYRNQQENVLEGRRLFDPHVIAPRLQLIVEKIEGIQE